MKSNKTRLTNDASTVPSSIGSSRMGYRVRSALKSLVRDAMKQEILMDDARFLRRIRFEPLERRELMAADFFAATSNFSQSSWAGPYTQPTLPTNLPVQICVCGSIVYKK